jgi:hypothetical protein
MRRFSSGDSADWFCPDNHRHRKLPPALLAELHECLCGFLGGEKNETEFCWHEKLTTDVGMNFLHFL